MINKLLNKSSEYFHKKPINERWGFNAELQAFRNRKCCVRTKLVNNLKTYYNSCFIRIYQYSFAKFITSNLKEAS